MRMGVSPQSARFAPRGGVWNARIPQTEESLVLTSAQDQLVEGQATYGMANLRPDRTGLPFIVFISQRDDARHAARVKVSPAPRVKADQMGSYSIAPFAYRAGQSLSSAEERALEAWVARNLDIL